MSINYLTGKTIEGGIGQGLRKLASIGFGMELIYSFVIIVCSLMIYFSTKEMYELSSHKGIKYFRMAFLFFAVAFFFRFSIRFLLMFFNIPRTFEFSHRFIGTSTLFLFLYASSMAIFYLLYSLIWKKWKFKKIGIYAFHFLALIISIISISTQNIGILLSLQFILFLFVTLLSYLSHKVSKKKKNPQLHLIYLLLFGFWIFNILDVLIPNFFALSQIFIYLFSLGIFLFITYKVLRTIGSG
ncbi:MAG: hypothetical protein ABFQ65_04390 [Nanoarchaeota archaeon]